MTKAAPLQPPRLAHSLGAGNVLAALILATATSSSLTALLFAGMAIFSPSGGGLAVAAAVAPLVLVFAFPVWLAGLTVIGGPCWWALHRLGVRARWAAALAGALLTLLVAGGYVDLSPIDRGSTGAWTVVLGLTVIGAVAGRVLAKIAYPRKDIR